ncbi:MAG: metallophosphoesterase [Fimbriimonadaceae bacterium]|nr:metallophosphoesterase [Fimbriimonadaceae bacterium]
MSGGDWSFGFVTDTHLGHAGGRGVHNAADAAGVAPRLRRLATDLAGCELVLHGGDLIDAGTWEQQRAFAALVADWPPLYVALGNHDALQPGDRERWPDALPQAFGAAELHHSFTHCGVHFVVLQSWWCDLAGEPQPYWVPAAGCVWQVPDEQLAWLDADLAAHAGLPTVVLNHPLAIPVVARVTGGSDDHLPPRAASADLLAILARHQQVELLLGGHAHVQQLESRAGLWHLAGGALVEPPCCWRRITLSATDWIVETLPVLPTPASEELGRPWVAGQPGDRARRWPRRLVV